MNLIGPEDSSFQVKLVLLVTQTSLLMSKFCVDDVICTKKWFLLCDVDRLDPGSATFWRSMPMDGQTSRGGWSKLVKRVGFTSAGLS